MCIIQNYQLTLCANRFQITETLNTTYFINSNPHGAIEKRNFTSIQQLCQLQSQRLFSNHHLARKKVSMAKTIGAIQALKLLFNLIKSNGLPHKSSLANSPE